MYIIKELVIKNKLLLRTRTVSVFRYSGGVIQRTAKVGQKDEKDSDVSMHGAMMSTDFTYQKEKELRRGIIS